MSIWDSVVGGASDLAGLYGEVQLSKDQADMLDSRAQIEALKVQQSQPAPQSQALEDPAYLSSGFSPSGNTGTMIAIALVAVSVLVIARGK
ncbi:MAG: hypothetical protein KBT88_03515 [Gammaproteobacteria bacterium]|nr:hypothetical protein [Gammaproteobacteria bacterium]MBQ0838829.1 hypothetical protein [Gammaproteobacteria bacterium]